jgi:hypothetical protein
MLDLNGQTEWSVPYQPSYPAYHDISVLFLQATNRFAVVFHPHFETIKESLTRIEWLTAGEGISRSMDLPPLQTLPQPGGKDIGIEMLGVFMPPSVSAVAAHWRGFWRPIWTWNTWCLLPAGLCALVGLWLGRRYSFSRRALAGWALLHFLFGLPGLLAFLSVQEWPARETCPGCGKLRVVDREKCPHCGADFAPPEKNGTEILELSSAD